MSRRLSKWDQARLRIPSACLLEDTGLDSAEKLSALQARLPVVFARTGSECKDDKLVTTTESSCLGLEGLEEMAAFSGEIENDKERGKQEAFTNSKLTDEDEASSPEDVLLAEIRPYSSSRLGARNRWKRLRNTVAFANRMRAANNDLLQEKVLDPPDQTKSDDSGRVGAAASDGSKTAPQVKAKGRRGMEGLVVEQNKSFISYFQDFYVACLKMPTFHFFVGVFLAPVALALIFTPFYVSDSDGLKLSDSKDEPGPLCELSKWSCLNVFLYSLSLSTTFGGSPIAAVSPFCLLMANLHTLMAQFLFVFLSGAVFARMSQPAHPIRCSKKAIVKSNDYGAGDQSEEDGKCKVFVVRLVLTGPPPCELVDAKIRLTFRMYMKLPSGSMFCSTQDLDLVRSEVAYLRYGITVRHVINPKSPIYGHTLDSLTEGDASFSLTVMGVERSSMQPIFHLEDYFVCDGDVIWDGDYLDFVRVNDKGQRVLEHSKIDMLKPFKVAGVVSQAISRMEGDVVRHKEKHKQDLQFVKPPSALDWRNSGGHIRELWKTMSSSFTRAVWT